MVNLLIEAGFGSQIDNCMLSACNMGKVVYTSSEIGTHITAAAPGFVT